MVLRSVAFATKPVLYTGNEIHQSCLWLKWASRLVETIFEKYNMLMTQPIQWDLKKNIEGKHEYIQKENKTQWYLCKFLLREGCQKKSR